MLVADAGNLIDTNGFLWPFAGKWIEQTIRLGRRKQSFQSCAERRGKGRKHLSSPPSEAKFIVGLERTKSPHALTSILTTWWAHRLPSELFYLHFALEPGQLESPRYNNRPNSLHSSLSNTNPSMHSTFNGTTELIQTATNSSYVNSNSLNNHSTASVEQLQKDLLKMKVVIEDMKTKFTDQIRDLVDELDEEKKARATLHIELERLQKQIQKSSLVNWNHLHSAHTTIVNSKPTTSLFVFLSSFDRSPRESLFILFLSLSQIPSFPHISSPSLDIISWFQSKFFFFFFFVFHIDQSILSDCSSLDIPLIYTFYV